MDLLTGKGTLRVTPRCWSSLKNRGYLKMSKGEVTSVELRSVEQIRTLPPAHCGGWAFSSLDDTCPCCVYPLDPVTSPFQRSARVLFASGRTPAGGLPWRMGRPRYRWSLAGRGLLSCHRCLALALPQVALVLPSLLSATWTPPPAAALLGGVEQNGAGSFQRWHLVTWVFSISKPPSHPSGTFS